jgi:RNA polymerase sigma-70 factor (ECF subfamily)
MSESASESASEAARWLAAARAGSPEALGQALEACRGYLILIAQHELAPELQPKGGASDLVQQTMLEAVRDFAHFQGDTEAELLHWLRRLLLNNVADFARRYRAGKKRLIDQEVALAAGDASADLIGGLAGSGPSAGTEAAAHEQAELVQHVLARLPEDYRRVVVLRYQEGQSFEEIGQALGLTANAARKLLVRAIERVQQELGVPP